MNIDNVPDSEGDAMLERDSTSMTCNQDDLEPVRNNQQSGSQSPGKYSISPSSLRHEADSTTNANLARGQRERDRTRSLQCSKCSKLRRACQGEPGKSCVRCIQDNIRCSFLEPRPFSCKWCNCDYTTEASLKGHITRKHSRETRRAVNHKGSETAPTPNSPQNSVHQISTSPVQHHEIPGTSPNCISNFQYDTPGRSEQAEPQRQRWPDGIHPLSQVPWSTQQSSMQNSQAKKTRLSHPDLLVEQPEEREMFRGQDQSLPYIETPASKPYQELSFEIFDTYEKRNLTPNYIQGTLDEIRDDIEQYGDFMRGKDRDTSDEIREQLRFLDEVTPLISLQEIASETSEIYGIQHSRLVIILRSMFAVKDNTRLEEALEILGPEARLIRLPHLICGVLSYYLLQFYNEKDPIREAELRATELTHGPTMAANTIQHSRLMAQGSYFFQARLENRAKKLAPSLYDLIRPLVHWQQGSPHNGCREQHVDRLRKIIFSSLRLAAELEARKGVFSFFWPRCGEQFDTNIHNDEADDSTPLSDRNKEHSLEKVVTCTLMPGVVRVMENKELVYAKATVIVN